MTKILGFIFIFVIGLIIGDTAKSNLMVGEGLLIIGLIMTIGVLYIYEKRGLFKVKDNILKIILLICFEIIGIVVGYFKLVDFSRFTVDIIIILFLIFLILGVFIKELIKLFSKAPQTKT